MSCSLHKYLDNKGSDVDFERVDALFDQLACQSSDKEGPHSEAKRLLVWTKNFVQKQVKLTAPSLRKAVKQLLLNQNENKHKVSLSQVLNQT